VDAAKTFLACLWSIVVVFVWALRIDSEPMESRWRHQ
jgi:hypothetical protein